MKLLGQLLLWASLAGGVMAAATAYLASLDAPDDQLIGLTLAAPAGKVQNPDGTHKPLVEITEKDETPIGLKDEKAIVAKTKKVDKKLTAEMLAQLRDAGVENVRVKEFSFARWRGKWYFALSLLVLAAAGWTIRISSKPAATPQSETHATVSPQQAIEAIRSSIGRLRQEVAELSDRSAAVDAIVQHVDRLQKGEMTAFVDARDLLIAQMGLARFAALMNSYAAAERQINRA